MEYFAEAMKSLMKVLESGKSLTSGTIFKKILVIFATVLSFASCQKIEQTFSAGSSYLYATVEDAYSTKTNMDENKYVRWSEGDQIVAFKKSSLSSRYQVLPSSVGKTFATFELISESSGTAAAWDHNVAYYPYTYFTRATKSSSYYILTVSLPSEQTYASGSFGNESFPMVAVSKTDDLKFLNVLGGIKLQLKGNQRVLSISLHGNDGEKVCGAATIRGYMNGAKPLISMGSTSTESVTLNCGPEGVQLSENKATDFIIALPPTVFSMGFKAVVTDMEGRSYVLSTDKENNISRNKLLVMPEVTLEAKKKLDYVDEYGLNHGKGIRVGESIWAPVNCGYHYADFPYGKLYQWGSKDGKSVDQSDGTLWNTGSANFPVKTKHDPCPSGWRVPTGEELKMLQAYNIEWGTDQSGMNGYWFSDPVYIGTSDGQIFLWASGLVMSNGGSITNRDNYGYYWSSSPYNSTSSLGLFIGSVKSGTANYQRTYGLSVRCVQE